MSKTGWELTPEEQDELEGLANTALEVAAHEFEGVELPEHFYRTMDPKGARP